MIQQDSKQADICVSTSMAKNTLEKRLNVWLRVQTDLYGNENWPFLCYRISKFVFHSALCSPQVPWCWIRERGLDWQERKDGKSSCWMVLLCREKFKGPLLYPAPHGARPCTQAQLRLCVWSVKTLCRHMEPSELGMCAWAKEKAELAAVGFPLPEDLGSSHTETFEEHVCFTSQRNWRGNVQLSDYCPFPQWDPDCSLNTIPHALGFSLSSFSLSLAEPLALCLYIM